MKMEARELICETKQLDKSNFKVDELLDFSNEEIKGTLEVVNGSGGSSTITPFNGSNSSISPRGLSVLPDFGCADSQFSENLCVPNDDIAELEWLSNFVEDSFAGQDLQRLQLISTRKHGSTDSVSDFRTRRQDSIPKSARRPLPKSPPPSKARSKRSRTNNWKPRALLLSPSPSNSSDSDTRRNCGASGGGERRCFHCATDKTPQWRTGPMGPKTLCNACGVRYKSGRLVPEYRPAASPTFTTAKHSNSHRKVMELRRQKGVKENQMILHPSVVTDRSSVGDYLIQQRSGSDFRNGI